MNDVDIISGAIDAAQMSARRFAMEVLGVDDRSVRKWIAGRALPGTVRVVCMAIIDRPDLAQELFNANLKIVETCPL